MMGPQPRLPDPMRQEPSVRDALRAAWQATRNHPAVWLLGLLLTLIWIWAS